MKTWWLHGGTIFYIRYRSRVVAVLGERAATIVGERAATIAGERAATIVGERAGATAAWVLLREAEPCSVNGRQTRTHYFVQQNLYCDVEISQKIQLAFAKDHANYFTIHSSFQK